MLQVLGKVVPESALYRPPYGNNTNTTPSSGGAPVGFCAEGGFCGPEEGLLLAHVELLLDEEIPLEQVRKKEHYPCYASLSCQCVDGERAGVVCDPATHPLTTPLLTHPMTLPSVHPQARHLTHLLLTLLDTLTSPHLTLLSTHIFLNTNRCCMRRSSS